MHSVGLVLHPQRDSAQAVQAVLSWARERGTSVYGNASELTRLNCAALPLSEEELGRRVDLLVSLGGGGWAGSHNLPPDEARLDGAAAHVDWVRAYPVR